MSDTPKFLEYRQSDHSAAAEGSVYVRDMLDWLRWERERGKEACLALLQRGRVDAAKEVSQRVLAFEDLLDVVTREDAAPIEEMDDFHDPNERPTRRLAHARTE